MDIGGLVSSFFKNAGPGGVMVMLIFGTACLVYYLLARWIVSGGTNTPANAPEDPPASVDA